MSVLVILAPSDNWVKIKRWGFATSYSVCNIIHQWALTLGMYVQYIIIRLMGPWNSEMWSTNISACRPLSEEEWNPNASQLYTFIHVLKIPHHMPRYLISRCAHILHFPLLVLVNKVVSLHVHLFYFKEKKNVNNVTL